MRLLTQLKKIFFNMFRKKRKKCFSIKKSMVCFPSLPKKLPGGARPVSWHEAHCLAASHSGGCGLLLVASDLPQEKMGVNAATYIEDAL